MLAVSQLLYALSGEIDGSRFPPEIAGRLAGKLERAPDGDGVRYLLEHKLGPLGVLAGGPSPAAAATPVLGLGGRKVLFSAGSVRPAAALLRHLFRPLVVGLVVALAIAAHLWLLRLPGPAFPTAYLAEQPAILLAILALTLAGALFHEFGHASASMYGGAEPGPIGAGIYIIWPVFYTDITDSYRLDRAGRIRTDLGGIYFNLLVTVLLGAGYAVSGEPLWGWAMLAQDVIIVQQFLPFLRLDGYYLVSDLLGVPDLFARIRPFLRSMLPGGDRGRALGDLRPRIRVAVGVWATSTAAILGMFLLLLIVRSPQIVATAWGLTSAGWYSTAVDLRSGDLVAGSAGLVGALLLTIQSIGLAVLVVRVARRAARPLVGLIGSRSA